MLGNRHEPFSKAVETISFEVGRRIGRHFKLNNMLLSAFSVVLILSTIFQLSCD